MTKHKRQKEKINPAELTLRDQIGLLPIKINKPGLERRHRNIIDSRNKLNDLTAQEWIQFTRTWFIHNPPPRDKDKILHPAGFPESLIVDFIKFFTKKNQTVLDPFLGTGSTLIACQMTQRNGIGIELVDKYARIAQKRLTDTLKQSHIKFASGEKVFFKIIRGDSRNIKKIWAKQKLPMIDFCITSPPYWNQLKRSYIRQRDRKNKGLDTQYSNDPKDLGNIDDYKKFIEEQKFIFDQVYDVMKLKGYLVVITNNVFANGRLYPLAFDTLISLSQRWVPKDEKIWCQNNKALFPFGFYNAWVGNRIHQYCLIFRKEK